MNMKTVLALVLIGMGFTAQGMDSSAGGPVHPETKIHWLEFMRKKEYFRGRDECDLTFFIGQAISTQHVTDESFAKFKKDLQTLIDERPIDPLAPFSPHMPTGAAGGVYLAKSSMVVWLQKICQRASFMRDNEAVDRIREILAIFKVDEGEFQEGVSNLPIPATRVPEEAIYMIVDHYIPQATDTDCDEFLAWLPAELEKFPVFNVDNKNIVRKSGNISLREYFDNGIPRLRELLKDPSCDEHERRNIERSLKQLPQVRDLIFKHKNAVEGAAKGTERKDSGEGSDAEGADSKGTKKKDSKGEGDASGKSAASSGTGSSGKVNLNASDSKPETQFTDAKKKPWWKAILTNKLFIAASTVGALALGALAWNKWGRKAQSAPAKR